MRRVLLALLVACLASISGVAKGQTNSRPSKRSFIIQATQAHDNGQLERAFAIARDCLKEYRRERECQRIAESAQNRLKHKWLEYTRSQDPANIPATIRGLEQLTLYDDSLSTRQWLADARQQQNELRKAAEVYVEEVHRSATAKPIPAGLRPYVRFLPDLRAAADEDAVYAAVQNAESRAEAEEFRVAIRELAKFEQHPEARSVLTRLRAEIAGRLVKSGQAANSLADIDSAFAQLSALSDVLTSDNRSKLASSLTDAAAVILKSTVDLATDEESGSALGRSLRDKLPANVAAHVRWDRLVRSAPGLPVSLKVVGGESECGKEAISRMTSGLGAALGEPFRHSETARFAVTLDDTSCSVSNRVIREEAVTSTYISRYQQVINPAYIRAQESLQIAQQELADVRLYNARNPANNRWARAAQVYAESSAAANVRTLTATLQETQPFLTEAVTAPYSPIRFVAVRTITVGAILNATDTLTGFADTTPIEVVVHSEGTGVRGVLPSDRAGLRNQDPPFKTVDALVADAVNKLMPTILSSARSFAAQAALERAEKSEANGEPAAVVIGQLLLALDLGVSSESLASRDSDIARFAQTPVTSVAEFKLAPRAIPARSPSSRSSTRRTSVRSSGQSTTSRTAMLASALDAVVTIAAGETTGSGFFIGSGQVITNAHVVEGAARIVVKTRAKESFLATVTKLSATDDLVLLTVPGADPAVGLPLSTAEPEVGMDVIAVGSPLGLEGTVTRGILSGLRRFNGVPYLQIDAPINPGNSGGPLLSEEGDVLGINTWKVPAKITDSIGFAISISHARQVFGSLLKADATAR